MAEKIRVDSLWGNIFKGAESDKRRSKVAVLGGIPLFAGLSRRELSHVADLVHDRVYEEGELIFKIEQPGAAFFIILEGELEVVVPREGGGFITLATLAEGDTIGELALLDPTPRSASARVTKKMESLAFFRADLQGLLQTDPPIGSKIYKNLSSIISARLRATNDQLREAEAKLKELRGA